MTPKSVLGLVAVTFLAAGCSSTGQNTGTEISNNTDSDHRREGLETAVVLTGVLGLDGSCEYLTLPRLGQRRPERLVLVMQARGALINERDARIRAMVQDAMSAPWQAWVAFGGGLQLDELSVSILGSRSQETQSCGSQGHLASFHVAGLDHVLIYSGEAPRGAPEWVLDGLDRDNDGVARLLEVDPSQRWTIEVTGTSRWDGRFPAWSVDEFGISNEYFPGVGFVELEFETPEAVRNEIIEQELRSRGLQSLDQLESLERRSMLASIDDEMAGNSYVYAGNFTGEVRVWEAEGALAVTPVFFVTHNLVVIRRSVRIERR